MLYLIGSIILTSYLTLSFKVLERFKISVLQAIVFNYWVCVAMGSVVNGSFPLNRAVAEHQWFRWACLMGLSFILLFNLIAFITQRIGVSVASVANKLSLVIPFLFSLYLYHENVTVIKVAGIVVALTAVVLTCWPKKRDVHMDKKKASPLLLFALPALLFVGSGLLDTMIKYVEQHYLDGTNQNAYLIASFASAAVIGSCWLAILFIMKKQRFDRRALLAGLLIGIPNYFSIWCLVQVLQRSPGESSAIIPINNMGIVLFSAVMAWLLFRERLSAINWAGILLAIAAIALIAFG